MFYLTGTDFKAIVPGGIYTDLERNNLISNNLIGKNDINNRWIEKQPVVYIKDFNGKLINLN